MGGRCCFPRKRAAMGSLSRGPCHCKWLQKQTFDRIRRKAQKWGGNRSWTYERRIAAVRCGVDVDDFPLSHGSSPKLLKTRELSRIIGLRNYSNLGNCYRTRGPAKIGTRSPLQRWNICLLIRGAPIASHSARLWEKVIRPKKHKELQEAFTFANRCQDFLAMDIFFVPSFV